MRKAIVAPALVAAFALGIIGTALAGLEFGLEVQNLLAAESGPLFGVGKPLTASSPTDVDAPVADPLSLATLAKGLSATVISTPADAHKLDMMALWPDDANPTDLIACNEADPTDPGSSQINIATGSSETILTGTQDCDPVHRTPWDHRVRRGERQRRSLLATDRPARHHGRRARGRCAELRHPTRRTASSGTRSATDRSRGSAYRRAASCTTATRTAPTRERPGVRTSRSSLRSLGPKAARSKTYLIAASRWLRARDATRLREIDDGVPDADYGQETQTGQGIWVSANEDASFPDLRAVAADLKLTGYYRPEDLAIDPAELDAGDVRFCGNNTGNEEADANYGETICITDGTLEESVTPDSIPQVQFFVIGNRS